MNFLVVGPGAMGCLFAARLKRAGFHVILLDYNQKRAEEINGRGIMVEGLTGKYSVKVPTVTEGISEMPDFVLICVKSNRTEEAGKAVKLLAGPETVVVTLQNGLGNCEILEKIFGRNRVLGGVTAEGATLSGPGKIIHAGHGETVVGPAGELESPCEKIVSAFIKSGFNARSTDNINELIWGKLVINVGINAITAITRLKNGRLPQIKGTRVVMEEAVKEAVDVAVAMGIKLPYPDPVSRVREVCRDTAGNIASMLQDVLNEKVTEVDFINGAVVREGKKLKILTPVNRTLTYLVQAIEETYHERIQGGRGTTLNS